MVSFRELITLLVRTTLLYVLAFVVLRLMGKRSLTNLAPFDLVVIIMIGEAAAIPISEDKIPILRGVIPVVIMGIMQYVLALITVYSRKFEEIAQGTSTLLVRDGQVLHGNLKKERVSIPDLMIGLREKGIANLDDVQEAWLEPKGKITVIKKKDAMALTRKDLRQSTLNAVDRLLAQNRQRVREGIVSCFAEYGLKPK